MIEAFECYAGPSILFAYSPQAGLRTYYRRLETIAEAEAKRHEFSYRLAQDPYPGPSGREWRQDRQSDIDFRLRVTTREPTGVTAEYASWLARVWRTDYQVDIGREAVVAFQPDDYALGWDAGWDPNMDRLIGQPVTIIGWMGDTTHGVRITEDPYEDQMGWHVPFFCLALTRPPQPIEFLPQRRLTVRGQHGR